MLQAESRAPEDGPAVFRRTPNARTHALPAVLIQLTAVLCLGLFLEVVAAMWPLLGHGGNPWAWLPVVFLPMALLSALAVEVAPGPICLRAYGATMALAVVVGTLGMAFHLAAHGLLGPHWVRWLHFGAWVGDPPIFAPMSFALLGLIGGSALVYRREMRGRAPEEALGRAWWKSFGVPAGIWRVLAGVGGAVGLLGIGLVASPARAIGVLAILFAAAGQALTILGTFRVGDPAPGRHARPAQQRSDVTMQAFAHHAD